MATRDILIAGQWRPATASGTFRALNPATGEAIGDEYPISTFADCDAALQSAAQAAAALRALPAGQIADFLDLYATKIDAKAAELVEMAHLETALPKEPRLAKAELPRTSNQLRQAAAAVREGSWANCIIDTKNNIRSYLAPIGPVAVFGPNNFPFAFNSIAGGDFASAIAAGNPVIAKAHSSHPGTSRIFAELAHEAAAETGLPPGSVQMLYRTSHADGEKLVSDHRIGASAYTGSRSGGLKLKTQADAAGKPIYLELSSVNPVLILPGALQERLDKVVEEFVGSSLMGTGQFCTNPGLVLLLASEGTEPFIHAVVERFVKSPVGTLLSHGVQSALAHGVEVLEEAGAELLTGGDQIQGPACKFANTILKTRGKQFLALPELFQTEVFGNAALFVVADSPEELTAILDRLEGNLTGTVYSHTGSDDDALYARLVPHLRAKVGRLLNDKMPTGVAVSPAMNHGGPYPSTGHPRFTAVGIPAAMERFAVLQSFDNVRPNRLPLALQDQNPTGKLWRSIDGVWTRENVGG